MTTRVTLSAASVRYPPHLMLYTAASGPVPALDELYLVVERDGRLAGYGEIRENIRYLSGLEPAEVRRQVIALAEALNWALPPQAIEAALGEAATGTSPLARSLIDNALVDWRAREAGVPICELFGARWQPSHVTNQSLFISDDERFLTMAESYVARGFTQMKVRVGAKSFDEDRRRLALLRQRFGEDIEIAIDANASWSFDDALAFLRELRGSVGLTYAEQPIAAGDWDAIYRLAEASPVSIMLDESVSSPAAVDRLLARPRNLLAHLKIAKLGGITPMIAAARRLKAGGVDYMIGQMNEGGAATAAAFHCALATAPAHAELYGADGLVDDPVSGYGYADGEVRFPRGPGLGVDIDTKRLRNIWESAA